MRVHCIYHLNLALTFGFLNPKILTLTLTLTLIIVAMNLIKTQQIVKRGCSGLAVIGALNCYNEFH